ncbi:LexA/Signal peptidase [Xylaria palmicola]|nr:LexA/Signal peptidase [Xylaria palmicola]
MSFLGHPLRVLFATVQTVAFAHVVMAYGVSISAGTGPSMLPTFLVTNEWSVTDKRYRRGRGVQVGDCVAYSIPVEPGQDGLKRVMGMPGDYVLLSSPPSSALRAAYYESEKRIGDGIAVDRVGRNVGAENMIQVPSGHCYIVGDNLPWSRDSRDFGPIPLALIKGKIIAKASFVGLNPMNWFTRVENGLQKPAEASDLSMSSRGA